MVNTLMKLLFQRFAIHGLFKKEVKQINFYQVKNAFILKKKILKKEKKKKKLMEKINLLFFPWPEERHGRTRPHVQRKLRRK